MQPRDTYDAQYEFQLQLLIQRFCAEVVDDASVNAGRPLPLPAVYTSSPSKSNKGQGGGVATTHSARGAATAASHAHGVDPEWNVSSGTHTPTPTSGNQTPSASQRRDGTQSVSRGAAADGEGELLPVGDLDMSDVLARHRLSCDTSLWELTRAAEQILEHGHHGVGGAVSGIRATAEANHERLRRDSSTARNVAYWCSVSGPFFDTPTAAKAFLQQTRSLQLREDAARHIFIREVAQWWRSFHRAAQLIHNAAARMRESVLRLWYREDRTRHEVASEEEVARAVLVYVHHTSTRGVHWTNAVYLGGETIAREEKKQRGRLIDSELRVRAELTAAHRLFGHFPSHRRWELMAFAQKALDHDDDSVVAMAASENSGAAMDSTSETGHRDDEGDRSRVAGDRAHRRPTSSASWTQVRPTDVSSIRFERPATGEPYSAYRHYSTDEDDVDVTAKAAARVARLTEVSKVQADRVRATSANLLTRLAKIESQDIAVKRRTVHAAKLAALQRREDIACEREARHAALRAASRVETLACEWQSYVTRHPEVADAHQSLLVGSPAYVEAVQCHASAFPFGVSGGHSEFNDDASRRVSGGTGDTMPRRRADGDDDTAAVAEDANMEPTPDAPGAAAAAVHTKVLPSSAAVQRRPVSAATSHATPKTKAELADSMLATIPCVPKCRLTPAQRRTLSYSAALRRKVDLGSGGDSTTGGATLLSGGAAGRAVRTILQRNRSNSIAAERVLAPMSVAAVAAGRRPSSSSAAAGGASYDDADGASYVSQQQQRRSRTPPLDPPEDLLLTTCMSVVANMKRRPYVYPQPPPLLYAEDGSDAIQGRNLLGDDVDLHLLSPLERILRWNMRAQLALRNDQIGVAEGNLKNAMAALHSAEKARRRAAKRRSQQNHLQSRLSPRQNPLAGSTSPTDAEVSLSLSGKEDAAGSAVGMADLPAGASASMAPAPTPSVIHDLSAPFVYLGLQNMKMLTYTNMAFLCRANGKVRDGLQHLHTVLQAQEDQQSEMNQYCATISEAPLGSGNAAGAAGGGRRSVVVVSPRSADETAVLKHMVENNYGVQADTLLNISALLLQMNNLSEATLYARRAVELLTSQALRENATLMASDVSSSGAPPAAVVLQYRPLFHQAVSALHNVAMAQAARPVANANDVEERRVGKASHAAALSLGRAVLGSDHALVARVEGNAKILAQMLSQ